MVVAQADVADSAERSLTLAGCAPAPLASYLKALGVLRLVSEQADGDAKGHWQDDAFVLISRLDAGALEEFLLERYRPTPLVAKLNEFQPHIAFSYGSHAEHFFRYLVDSGTTTAIPRVWRYSGDPISPGGKELIEKTFGCTVHSTYSSVETGRIGFQCERCRGFHLDVDLTAVRVVDDLGRDVPAGEDGEIIVSNLQNRAMVLLNYRQGDLGALAAAPCPCGRSLPLLERLQGRRGELIALADGRVLPSLLVGSLFSSQLGSVLKSQIVHPAPGYIRWRIVPFTGVDQEELRSALLSRGREVLGEGTRAEVEFVDDIPSTRVGKFRQVVRQADPSSVAEAEG